MDFQALLMFPEEGQGEKLFQLETTALGQH